MKKPLDGEKEDRMCIAQRPPETVILKGAVDRMYRMLVLVDQQDTVERAFTAKRLANARELMQMKVAKLLGC